MCSKQNIATKMKKVTLAERTPNNLQRRPKKTSGLENNHYHVKLHELGNRGDKILVNDNNPN